ncbi:MAG: hypothetical protein ACLQOO_36125 [Terriglobia bacterium]
MPARYSELVEMEAGLEKTHVWGVELDDGRFTTTGDDLGLFCIVPWLALKLGLSVGTAYDLFIALLIGGSFISGVLGFLRLTPAMWPRLVAITALALVAILAARIGDVYVVMGALPVALVPWILVAARRGSLPVFIAIGAIVGGITALANAVRSQSGTGLVVFMFLAWALSTKVPSRMRLAGLGTAFLCLALGWAAFQNVVAKRNAFLGAHAANESLLGRYGHPFWHSVYIGFGYVENDAVPAYRDEVAVAKVCSMDPAAGFTSPQYESDLRTATLQLVRARPGLVVYSLLAKLGVVLAYLLLFGNIGWLALFRRPVILAIDLAFFAAMAFNSLFGLLVVPFAGYLLGMIAYAAVFGAISFMLAAESGGFRNLGLARLNVTH